MGIDRRELEGLIPSLRRYARGLAGDRHTADDLVQDCLVLALDRERQFRGERLAPWVFAILSNVGRSRHRTRRRAPPMAPLGEVADGGTDPAMRTALFSALSALPEEQRKALLLTTVEGFSYEETANILGVPLGTVMSRIWRARTSLAERLGETGATPLRRVK
jgi:RNA polymerase sigma-70 factor (ECF subfamily)